MFGVYGALMHDFMTRLIVFAPAYGFLIEHYDAHSRELAPSVRFNQLQFALG